MEKINENFISALIEKYFNAETSLSEELLIKRYFRETPESLIPGELLQYKDLFTLFDSETNQVGMEEIKEERVIKRRTLFMHPHLMKWGSVAAAAIILVAMFVINPRQNDTLKFYIDGEKVNDKEMAVTFADSKMEKMNDLIKKLEKSEEYIGTISKANKSVSSLDKVSKVLSQS